jgi:hypothetical protein
MAKKRSSKKVTPYGVQYKEKTLQECKEEYKAFLDKEAADGYLDKGYKEYLFINLKNIFNLVLIGVIFYSIFIILKS